MLAAAMALFGPNADPIARQSFGSWHSPEIGTSAAENCDLEFRVCFNCYVES